METNTSSKYFPVSTSLFVLIIFNVLHVKAFECGNTDFATPLIIKGTETIRGEWPFLTALYLAQEFTFFCAGNIISTQHVLTAAHCINEKNNPFGLIPANVVARLGAYNLKLGNESHVLQRNVSEIHVHPDWDVYDDKYDADLAILLLNKIVPFTDYIRPVCMPADNSSIDNVKGSVVVWGLTEIGTNPNFEFIKHVSTRALNDSYCYTTDYIAAAISTVRTFCARGLDGNPNSGDSGGGFHILYGSAWVQYGIISSMRTNSSGLVDAHTITIYTNVLRFKNWITETVYKTGGTVGEADIVAEIELRCDYEYFVIYKKYGCRVNDLNIRSDNNAVTSCGPHRHSFLYSHNDVEIIIFNNGTMFSIPFGIGKIFKNLKILENERLALKRIKRTNLKNLINLVHLQISHNDIETLEYDCLRHLPNLEVFALLYNKIQQIHERTFEKNPKLREVQLYFNRLKSVPRKLFQNNSLLEIVTLGGNSLTTIDETIFASNAKLREVYLNGNRLTALPGNVFRNNLLLQVVYLNHNTKLKEVYLDSNQLTALPGNLFKNNLLLETVNLNQNSLKLVQVDFTHFTNIKRIWFENNVCIDARYDPHGIVLTEFQRHIDLNCTSANK